jgi:hypothetical protein
MRDHTVAIARRHGKPSLIMDLGFLRRANNRNHDGYYQLGWDRLCWLPEDPQPKDRLAKLQLTIHPDHEPWEERSRRWLIAAQVPEDMQHGMDEDQLGHLYRRYYEAIRELQPDAHITLRLHPQAPMLPAPCQGLAWDAVDLRNSLLGALTKAGQVVTYNSTTFYEAYLEGVPVFCSPSAHYREAAAGGTDLLTCAPVRRRVEEKVAYLSRVAYAQWTMDEAASGLPWDFLKYHMP